MSALQSKHILLDNEGDADGVPYDVINNGTKLIIVDGDAFGTVNIQVESSKGNFVNIADGEFTASGAKVIQGIISTMTIRAVVVGGTNVTVEISE